MEEKKNCATFTKFYSEAQTVLVKPSRQSKNLRLDMFVSSVHRCQALSLSGPGKLAGGPQSYSALAVIWMFVIVLEVKQSNRTQLTKVELTSTMCY